MHPAEGLKCGGGKIVALAKIPEEDHVIRYCRGADTFRKELRPKHRAFKPQKKHPMELSVNWCEYLSTTSFEDAVAQLRQTSGSPDPDDNSCYVALSVEDVTAVVSSSHSPPEIVHTWKHDNPSHSDIRKYPATDRQIQADLAFLAARSRILPGLLA